MLKACAPGFSWADSTHFRVISWNGQTYHAFPKLDNIEIGHIRKMVRTLGISKECANRHIPKLFNIEAPPPGNLTTLSH